MIDLMGYATGGKEFAVMDDLAKLDVTHWRGTRIEFERRGNVRTAEPYEYPALPNYVWITCDWGQLHRVLSVKHLSPLVRFMTRADVAGFAAFRRQAEARLAEARRIIGNRDAIVAYRKGERLEIRDGAFAGALAEFGRMVIKTGQLFPQIEAEVELFGRKARMLLDPLDVRRAAE